MALGAITVVERVASQGPVFYDRVTIVGDGAYASGGSAGFEALFRAAVGSDRTIVGLVGEFDGTINSLEYDHANDKLFVRVRATGVESAVSDQSGNTYRALIISK